MGSGIQLIIIDMEEEFKYGLMDPDMRVIGKIIKQILKENFTMLTEMYMKVHG